MKKIISMIMALAICLSLCACGSSTPTETTPPETVAETTVPETTVAETTEPTPESRLLALAEDFDENAIAQMKKDGIYKEDLWA